MNIFFFNDKYNKFTDLKLETEVIIYGKENFSGTKTNNLTKITKVHCSDYAISNSTFNKNLTTSHILNLTTSYSLILQIC